jgi:non-heme chloroperoxidase
MQQPHVNRRRFLGSLASLGAIWGAGGLPAVAAVANEPSRPTRARSSERLVGRTQEGMITTTDDVGIHYVDTGPPGPVILLLGGWTMSIPWWREQLSALGNRFRVVAIDARAYGESDKVTFGHRIARHAADVRDVIDALLLRRVTVVGWSLAANTLLAYLEQFGPYKLQSGVHLEMSPYPKSQPAYPVPYPDWELGFADVEAEQQFLDAWLADPATVASDLVDVMFAQPVDPADKEWMVAEILKTPVEAAAEIEWDTFHSDWRSMVPTVDLPMLVMSGRQSLIYPNTVGEWMADHLPNAQWHIFENSGHAPFLEEPDQFNQVLVDFTSASRPGSNLAAKI